MYVPLYTENVVKPSSNIFFGHGQTSISCKDVLLPTWVYLCCFQVELSKSRVCFLHILPCLFHPFPQHYWTYKTSKKHGISWKLIQPPGVDPIRFYITDAEESGPVSKAQALQIVSAPWLQYLRNRKIRD